MERIILDLEAIAEAQDKALHGLADGWQPPEAPPAWQVVKRQEDGAWYQSASIPITVCVTRCREDDGKRWAHLSVAHPTRMPKYRELAAIKDWALGPNAKALQLFVPKSEHVNIHPFCLHLWHCLDGDSLPDFTHGTGSI